MKSKPKYVKSASAAVASLLASSLVACSGGGGGGDNITLATDNQGEDPVVVEVAVAYIKRPLPEEPGDLRDPLRFEPGAKLYLRDRASTSADDIDVTARVADIVAAEEGMDVSEIALDVRDVESSFDGETLIFAARAVPEPVDANLELTTWNLWTYDIANDQADYVISSRIKRNEGVESGGGHDLAPYFLPDDRIVFSSTRQVASQARQLNEGRIQLFAALDEDGRTPAAVLHLYDPQLRGDEFRQISFNLSHDLDPVVLSSGEIVFSRWNNTGTDHVSLFRIEPSGAGLSPLYGFHSNNTGTNGSNVFYTQPRELSDGRLASLVRQPASETQGGNIVLIDTTNYAEVDQALWETTGLIGPGQENLTATEIRTDETLSSGGQFASVYALDDGTGRLLVSWSDCRVIDEDADVVDGEPLEGAEAPRILPCTLQPDNTLAADPLYGAWIYDPADLTQRPVVLAEEGFMISEIIAAEPRSFPPLVPQAETFNPDLAFEDKGQLVIDSVYDLDGVDDSPAGISQHATPGTPAYLQRPARFLRILQPVPIPDDDVFEIPDFAVGVSRASGFREILGYVPVEPDGSVTVTIPASRPFDFEVLDGSARRIGPRHNYWLQLGAGEVRQCTGCHEGSSDVPHGRRDSQPPSANPGAVALPEGILGFPATNSSALYALEAGDTMAEVWDQHRPIDNTAAVERELSLAPTSIDEWHAPTVDPDAPVSGLEYPAEWTDIPVERALIVNNFDAGQPSRIVINYIDHIQPIWERSRDARLDSDNNPVDTCVGCHSTEGNTLVAAGQLELTTEASDIDPDHYRSYRELLSLDQEQWLDAADAFGERTRLCTIVDDEGEELTISETVPLSSSMRAGSANGSTRFFNCFEGGTCGPPDAPPLPDNCVEEGVAVPSTRNTVDHVGLLTAPELRLISEWLDIGAQYYNNPFDDRLVED